MLILGIRYVIAVFFFFNLMRFCVLPLDKNDAGPVASEQSFPSPPATTRRFENDSVALIKLRRSFTT